MMLGGGGVLISERVPLTFRHQAGFGLSNPLSESPLFAEAIEGALRPVWPLSVETCSVNDESKDEASSVGSGA